MSFELTDNLVQVAVMGACAMASFVRFVKYRDRVCIILAFAYACICMGTLYYVLHLAITGHVPRVFYVSEILWISFWLFLLSVQIVRTEKLHPSFAWLPALCAAAAGVTVMLDHIMGPSMVVTGAFAAVIGTITYLTIFSLTTGISYRSTDFCFLLCVILQLLLYISSDFITDYTRFNLYFAIDLALTGCFAALFPLNMREVRQK